MALTILVILVSLLGFSQCQVDDTNNWRKNNDNDYDYYVSAILDETSKSWQEARQLCMLNGGDLASVLNENERNFITGYSNEVSTGAGLWIGLNDLDDWDNDWKWSDGNALSLTLWADNNPDTTDNLGLKCAWQWGNGTEGSAPDGLWRNGHCGLMKGFVCKRRTGSSDVVTNPPTPEIGGYCPTGYYGLGNKCYKPHYRTFDTGRTWEEAVGECRTGPGILPDLASIHNDQEQALITSFTQRNGATGLWIGLSRGAENEAWRWVDNSQFSYTSWAPGEPTPEEHCTEIWSVIAPGYWNNIQCHEPRGFVCQTFKDASSTIPTPNPSLFPCPDGYVSYYYSCYKAVKLAPKDWASAEADCKADGAVLASVLDVAENGAVWTMASAIGSPVWLGINDRDGDGLYEWLDSWAVVYTNWGENEPSREEGGGCTALDQVSGTWRDDVCSSIYGYICKSTTYTPATTPPNIPGSCPDERWEEFGSHCYYFEKDNFQSKTWLEANTACFVFHEGATLASIHNQAENDFIYNHMQDVNPTAHTWIGMYRSSQDNSFHWADFSPIQYENWGEGEPNGQDVDDGGCVRMYTSSGIPDGVWDDHYCDNRAYNQFVCKTVKLPVVTTPTQGPGSCPETWFPLGSYCYHFRPDDFRTWSQAQDHCREYNPNSQLVSITSDGEDQWIREQMTERSELPEKRAYWIGLIKDGLLPEGFYWYDGTPFEYENWGVGEPNDMEGLEKCAEVTSFNSWNDWQCEWALGHVCKMPKCGDTGCADDNSGGGNVGDGSGGGLSSGQTAGVVIGVLLGIAVLGLVSVLALGFFGIIEFGPCARKNDSETRRLA